MGVEKSLLYLQEHNSHGFTAHTDVMAVGRRESRLSKGWSLQPSAQLRVIVQDRYC
jgi:hypothetical protein